MRYISPVNLNPYEILRNMIKPPILIKLNCHALDERSPESFFRYFFFHSIFKFVFTLFLSAVDASLLAGRGDVPLLSSELDELTDCSSDGDCGTLPCEAASAI